MDAIVERALEPEAVGDALGCGVVFTSTDGRERAAHLDEAQRAALAGAEMVDPSGRVRVERIDPEGSAVGEGEAVVRRVVAAGVDSATDTLTALGFEVVTEEAPGYLGLGFVFSMDPDAGSEIPKGSTVTLYLI